MEEKNNPLVSIIIPIYNTDKYIEECLDSVLNQTLKQIEVICVDDKSTDNSLNILKKYQKKDKRLKIIENNENKGQAICRNIAMNISKGKYLSFIDSDDKIDLNAYEKLYEFSEKYNLDMVLFNFVRFDDSGRTWASELHMISISNDVIPVTNILKNNEFVYDTSACNKFIKKSFLDNFKITFERGRLYEDLLFSMHLFCSTDLVGVYPLVNYYWRNRSNKNNKSVTQSYNDIKNLKDRLYIIESIYRFFDSSDKYRELITPYNQKLLAIDYRHIINQINHENEEFNRIIKEEIKPIIKNFDHDLFKDIDNLFKVKYDILSNGEFENLIYLRKYELDNIKSKSDFKVKLNERNKEIKKINHKFKNEKEKLINSNKNLNDEIKIIKSTKGWLKYKIKNIYSRLMNKSD